MPLFNDRHRPSKRQSPNKRNREDLTHLHHSYRNGEAMSQSSHNFEYQTIGNALIPFRHQGGAQPTVESPMTTVRQSEQYRSQHLTETHITLTNPQAHFHVPKVCPNWDT